MAKKTVKKAKDSANSPKDVALSVPIEERVTPRSCKRYAKKKVAASWPKIVSKLVEEAEEGSYNHTKLLVEMSGIKDEESKPARRGKSNLTKILLKKLSEKETEKG